MPMEHTTEHHTETELARRFSAAKEVRLATREFSRMRSVLAAKIRGDGTRADAARRRMWQGQGAPFLTFFLRPVPAVLLIMFFVVSGSGISFAAEGALPGDFLYPVKVAVNEEIRARLAFSDEAKTEWEAARVERRLEEAETLAEQGRLDAEILVKIEERFEEHAERMRGRLDALEAGGNIESAAALGSNFETVLNTHERILEKFAGRDAGTDLSATIEARIATATPESVPDQGGKGREVRSLLEKIRSKKRGVREVRVEAEAKVSNLAEAKARDAAEARMRSAEKKLQDARAKLDERRPRLGAEAVLRIEARLNAAIEAFAEGNAALGSGAASQAFIYFQRAFRIAQEAELLLKASERLERDVIINGFSGDGEEAGNDIREDLLGDEEDDSGSEEGAEEVSRISTKFGELELRRHGDGTTELRGALMRETPCVNWKLDVSTESGKAPARAEIRIRKETAGELCIQVLGKPQEIRASVRMKDTAEYRVMVDGETVFEGTIGESSGSGDPGEPGRNGHGGENESQIETEVEASASTGGNRGGTSAEGNASVNVEIINE